MHMDLLNLIDWVGDDGVLELHGRQLSIVRLGPDLYSISASDDDEDVVTVVGSAALSYWLTNWSAEKQLGRGR